MNMISSLNDNQLDDLLMLYRVEWWTKDRRREDVVKMLAHSQLVIGLCEEESGRLVAFVRVLTDYIYKALILDVIVAHDHRGQGLGKRLMDEIVQHPDLQGVRHFELYCVLDMIPFYQQWGFTHELGTLTFMRKVNG